MSKMWIKTRLLGLTKLLFLPVSLVSGYWREKRRQQRERAYERDSELEIERRRRDTGAGLKKQLDDIWNAHYDPPAMEKLLQRYTLRTKKDEELQRAKEERTKRNTALSLITQHPGYKILVEAWKMIELDALIKIRHPEYKDFDDSKEKGFSDERFLGKQLGRLEVIEETRIMVMAAKQQLQLERERAAEEERRKREQNATTE